MTPTVAAADPDRDDRPPATGTGPATYGADLAAALGRTLRTPRGDRSLRSVAAELGLSHSTLHALEAGTDNPTLNRAAAIASAYGAAVHLTADPKAGR